MVKRLLPAAACAALLALAAPVAAPASGATAAGASCSGAAAMANFAECGSAFGSTRVSPSPARELFEGRGAERHKELCVGGLRRDGKMEVCRIGRSQASARLTIAIIGDSHAAQWRPALSRLAGARGWRVLSLTSSRCDYTTEDFPRIDGPDQAACTRFRREVPRWLKRNPSVRSVLFSQLSKAGKGEAAGYQEAWGRLPDSVQRIGVIRDNPRSRDNARVCVVKAIARGKAPGPSCTLARSRAVRTDSALRAAKSFSMPQTAAIDLTDLFCHDSKCYPVIGGTLVYADGSHQSKAFNRTLAPYLLEQLRAAWPDV